MGTPLLTAFRLFGAFSHAAGALGRRLRPQPRPQGRAAAPTRSGPALASAGPAPSVSSRRPVRHLRVVRVLESSPAAASAGRMVISGRMADVCAELERLAALEAAAG